jgi:hypothetical protein
MLISQTFCSLEQTTAATAPEGMFTSTPYGHITIMSALRDGEIKDEDEMVLKTKIRIWRRTLCMDGMDEDDLIGVEMNVGMVWDNGIRVIEDIQPSPVPGGIHIPEVLQPGVIMWARFLAPPSSVGSTHPSVNRNRSRSCRESATLRRSQRGPTGSLRITVIPSLPPDAHPSITGTWARIFTNPIHLLLPTPTLMINVYSCPLPNFNFSNVPSSCRQVELLDFRRKKNELIQISTTITPKPATSA